MGPIFAQCGRQPPKSCAKQLAKYEELIEQKICFGRNGTSFASKYGVTRWLRNSEHEEIRPLPGEPTQATVRSVVSGNQHSESRADGASYHVVIPFPNPPHSPTPQGRSRPEHRFLPPASAIAASGLEGKIQPGDHSFQFDNIANLIERRGVSTRQY